MKEQRGRKVPQIRFKGFEGEWKTFTLGELGEVATNKRIFIHQTSSTGDVPFYKIGTFGKKPKLFISQGLFEAYKEQFPYPQKGDLLISVIGSIGRVVEYRGEDEYFQDSNIVWLQHDGAIVNKFLKQFYSFVKWSGLEGSTIKHLYNKNILETEIQLPSQKEQTQIGYYFEKFDQMIEQHKLKHEKLVMLKKAMLKKMFPQNGASIPEVRFKGFSKSWVEKTLGELADIVRGASPRPIKDPKWFDEKSIVGWLRISDVTEQDGRIYYLEQRISKAGEEKTRVLTKPHLLLSIAASVGKPVINYVQTGVHDGFLIFQNPTFDQEFMYQWLKMFETQWHKYGQPGSQVNLNSDIVKNQNISIPEKDEQQKIGSFFGQLDTLIRQQSTKVKKLKQLKSACFEKMFV